MFDFKQTTNVESIKPDDLSDFLIETVPCGAQTLKFKTPLVLTPTLNDSKQLFCLEQSRLGISVFASTREQLLEELQQQVCVLWLEYALESDARLSPSARELKARLLDAIEAQP